MNVTTVPQPPLSPSIPLPSIGGLGAEDGKPMGPLTQGGEYEFVCGACNVGEEDGSFDAEDVQPQQTLRTPELPSLQQSFALGPEVLMARRLMRGDPHATIQWSAHLLW